MHAIGTASPTAPRAEAGRLPAISLLMHLAGTRFGAEAPTVVQALQRLARRERPQLLLAAGDLTAQGASAQFDDAARFIAGLGVPSTLALPGAFDLPRLDLARRLSAPYADFRRVFGADDAPRFAGRNVWVAGIDATRPWRFGGGAVSAQQARDAALWLREAPPSVLRVVLMHPAPMSGAGVRTRPHGAAQALQCWADAGVHLVLCGPACQPGTGERQVTPFEPGQAVPVAAADSATVNLLRHTGASHWRLECWVHAASHDDFVLAGWTPLCAEPAA